MLKKIIILILVLIVLLGFPVLINVLFTIKSPFNFLVAEFSAGDLLAYGALVGSIFYGFMMFKKEHRNNVKPFFTVKLLTVENNYNMAYDLINTNINRKDPSDETPLYKEFIASEFYVILDESGINYQNRLSNYDQEIIKKKGLELKRNGETRSAILNDYISVPFIIENIGNGSAINCRIGINRIGDASYYLLPRTFKKYESLYLHIYSRNIKGVMMGDYTIEIHYNDIYGTGYMQSFEFKIGNKGEQEYYLTINSVGKNQRTSRNKDLIDA